MANRKPLVLHDGQIEQIQSGDTLDAAVTEKDVVSMVNDEAADAITIGMPVYNDAAGGVKKAQADAVGTCRVLGLCADASIAHGDSGNILTDGVLTNADWTAVIGAANLTAKSIYYLDAANPGKLTTTPPASGFIVEVGQAISTTELEISQKAPIKL